MKTVLLVGIILCSIFLLVLVVQRFRGRKSPMKKGNSVDKLPSFESENGGPIIVNQDQRVFSTENIQEKSTEIYLDKGDRDYWYQIVMEIEGYENPYIRDFYAYVSGIKRDRILNEYIYVNDREFLMIDDDGESYLNQQLIKSMRFSDRKIIKQLSDKTSDQVDSVEKSSDHESVDKPDNETETVEIASNGFQFQDKQFDDFELGKKGKFFRPKKITRPTIKKMTAKKFNRYFAAAVILICGTGVFALLRTFGISNRVDTVQAVVSQKQTISNDEVDENEPLKLNQFMQSFFETYIPLSEDDGVMKERSDKLKGYFADNVQLGNETRRIVRNLRKAELVEWTPQDGVSQAKYRVSSESVVDQESRLDTVIYVLNVVEKDGRFSIISNPSIIEDESLTIGFEGIEEVETTNETVAGTQFNELQKFVELFLNKYAAGSQEELELYMANVEKMGGNFELENMESFKCFKNGNDFNGYVIANFKEKETGISHKEQLSMKIVKQNKQFRITTFNHYLGGLN